MFNCKEDWLFSSLDIDELDDYELNDDYSCITGIGGYRSFFSSKTFFTGWTVSTCYYVFGIVGSLSILLIQFMNLVHH